MLAGASLQCSIDGLADALARRGIVVGADGAVCVTDDPADLARTGAVILLVNDARLIAGALDAGAADAVLRTTPVQELAARIAARLRATASPLGLGELVIDRIARTVTRAGRAVRLLPREYALLLHLAQHAGRTVSRAALLEAVWGLRFDPGTNVVAVHMSRLRAKLDHGFDGSLLHTDKGMGYRLALA